MIDEKIFSLEEVLNGTELLMDSWKEAWAKLIKKIIMVKWAGRTNNPTRKSVKIYLIKVNGDTRV